MTSHHVKILTAILAILGACESAPVDQQLDEKVFYRRDMYICASGDTWQGDMCQNGMLVLPVAKQYKIKVTTAGKLHLFTATNCFRQEKQINARFEGDDKRAMFSFTPVQSLELDPENPCPFELVGLEKDRGRHSWGYVDFQNPKSTMVASIKCNGYEYDQGFGVGVCQTRHDLLTQIKFKYPVRVAPLDRCPLPATTDERTFTFKAPVGRCVYAFVDKNAPHYFYRFTLMGYEHILYRVD